MPTAPRPGLTLRQGAEVYAPERLVPSVTSNPARLLRLARKGLARRGGRRAAGEHAGVHRRGAGAGAVRAPGRQQKVEVRRVRGGLELRIDGTQASVHRPGRSLTGVVWWALASPILPAGCPR